jgi:beta-1,4-mannosyl-glycoprotein beta-1,4-N-acetylglucosaminyltransferase
MIYDCFNLFNEIDILNIRLHLLNHIIDKFVIVESTVTFSGMEKPLYFDKVKHEFKQFEDKIIHIIVDNTPIDSNNLPKNIDDTIKNGILNNNDWPKNEPQWGREIFQRESIFLGLKNCEDNDIIIVSDIDEIPNPDVLQQIINNLSINDIIDFRQKMFYYHINLLLETNWSGSKLTSWNKIKNYSLNHLRQNKFTNKTVYNSGWHWSYMGGSERIKDKIEAYSHQEFNNDFIKNNISNNISSNKDVLLRPNISLTKIDINNEYPSFLIDFVTKNYPYLL